LQKNQDGIMSDGKKKKCFTTGYRYYTGLHLVFCHKLDSIVEIGVGEKTAWTGDVSSNSTVAIQEPNLFGGESREGGIVGNVDFCFGGPTQGKNAYLQSVIGAVIPAFRGVFGLVVNKCMVSANNPYIKSWWVKGRRTKTGWRNDLSDILASDGNIDMNPAHIIREALTGTEQGGLGYPELELNDESFEDVAYLLAKGTDPNQEAFGLSLIWAKNTSTDDFISTILPHNTGLLTLKLIRNDYETSLIPTLDKSCILSMEEFKATALGEAINQVTVKYVDRDNQVQAITVQDLAGIERTGGQIIGIEKDYPGIAVGDLAARVASRELVQNCVPLTSCTLVINRKYSSLETGDCFKFTWLPLGIEEMIMRITSVEIGDHTDSKIRIKAVRDVFSFNASIVGTPAASLWVSPYNHPSNALNRMLMEYTYYQFVKEYAGDTSSVLAELDDTSTAVQCFCEEPTSDTLNYEMWTRAQGAIEWVKQDTPAFAFVGVLGVALVPELESVVHLSNNFIDSNLIYIGSYALIGTELVGIISVDVGNKTVTVSRGVIDTVPISHGVSTKMYFFYGAYGLDTTERTVTDVVEVRMLPTTSLGTLELASASNNTITCVGRMMRPYPPGNLTINGDRWPVEIGHNDNITLSWAHRNRLTQTVDLVTQDEGDYGPEGGVDYTIRFYGQSGTLNRTVTDITDNFYEWEDEVTDSGLGRLNDSVRVELEAVRGTLTSLYKWNVSFARTNGGGPGGGATFPSSITGLVLRLNASLIEGLVDGDAVATWPDVSGLNNNATQSNATYRPIFKTNILNGKPVLRFGSGHALEIPEINTVSAFTYFVVWKRESTANNNIIFAYSSGYYQYLQYTVSWYIGSGAPNVTLPAEFKIVCGSMDYADMSKRYINNVAQENSTAMPLNSYHYIFKYIGLPGFSLTGDVAEMIVFNKVLNETERNQVNAYLASAYAIT
jgi:hypothetical protein